MLADDFIEHIPHFRSLFFDEALRAFNRRRGATRFERVENKRLKKLQRHLFRQSALIQPEFGANDDDRTAGIIDPLSQEILSEAALLAFKHIAQGLQRPFVGTADGAPPASIIKE